MPEYKGPNPLNQAHCDGLSQACKIGAQVKELIAACESCGIPMDEQKAMSEQATKTAQALKATFFPQSN